MQPTPCTDKRAPGIAWLPLSLAIVLMLVLTVYPRLLIGADGGAAHGAAVSAMAAISAGFVRGVGFVPRNPVLRGIFSTPACLLGMAVAAALMLAT